MSKIQKRQPLPGLFSRFINESFWDPFLRESERSDMDFMPAVDVIEKDKKYVLTADLPGMEQKDIKIELQDNVLTLSGKRTSGEEEESECAFRVERVHGHFCRSFSIGNGVDIDNINATFNKGVLKIEIPKTKQTQSKTISIK